MKVGIVDRCVFIARGRGVPFGGVAIPGRGTAPDISSSGSRSSTRRAPVPWRRWRIVGVGLTLPVFRCTVQTDPRTRVSNRILTVSRAAYLAEALLLAVAMAPQPQALEVDAILDEEAALPDSDDDDDDDVEGCG